MGLRLQVNFGKKDLYKYKELVEIFEKIPFGAGIRNDYAKELMNYAIKHGAPLPDGYSTGESTKSLIKQENTKNLSNELRDIV